MNLNRGLVISSGGEDLTLLGRDGGVAVDQLGEHAAHRLNAKRQRGDVQQQQALDVAAKHAALNRCADSDALVGVDTLEAFLTGQLLDLVLHSRDTGRAADQQNLGNIVGSQTSIGHRLLDRAGSRFDQMSGQFVELCTRQRNVQMLRAGCVSGDIRQVDVRGGHAGQFDLGLLGCFLQPLHGNLVVRQIDALCLLEFGNEVVHDALIKVVAAEVGVAVGGQNLDNAVADIQNGNIKRAAAKVIDHDFLLGLLVNAVGQSGCGRLVDDTLDVKTCDLAGVLGGLTLCVVEICRNGNDGLSDGAAQIGFCIRLQLLQDHRGDLLRGVLLTVDIDLIIRTHAALDGSNSTVVVGNGLTLCDLTDHSFTGLGKRDNRRGGAVAFGVCDHDGFAAFHNGDAAVGSTKVNANNLTHNNFLLYEFLYLQIYMLPDPRRRVLFNLRPLPLRIERLYRRP